MPARYLALATCGEASAASAALAAAQRWLADAGWRRAARDGALQIWTPRARAATVSRAGDAWIVGTWRGVLPRDPGPVSAEVLRDRGWGAYVSLHPAPDGGWRAFRDPSGAAEAVTWTAGPLVLLADDLEGTPAALGPADLALDWDALARIVRHPVAATARVALRGVRALAPGEHLPLGGASPGRLLWRPQAAAGPLPPSEAEARLRAAVLDAVAAEVQAGGQVLLEVSGGLDSSLVAGAVAASGLQGRVAAAVNQYVSARDGDERRWAMAVARRAGLPLVTLEKPLVPFTEDDFRSLARGVRPALEALDPPRDLACVRLAAEQSAGALVTGQGGDAVFYQMPSALIAADAIRDLGWRRGLVPVAELARRLRRSVWSVLAEALGPPTGFAAAPLRRFWGPAVRDADGGPPHPWLEDLEALPPGKALQVANLAFCQGKFGRSWRSDALELRHPLLAQPVLEAALAIPAWRLAEGGQDRGLARRLFADLLPTEVAVRRSKGMLPGLYARRVALSLDMLRPWLLDGALADAGLIDRAAVADTLTPEALLWRAEGARLLPLAMLEGWVRWWQTRVPDARTRDADPARARVD